MYQNSVFVLISVSNKIIIIIIIIIALDCWNSITCKFDLYNYSTGATNMYSKLQMLITHKHNRIQKWDLALSFYHKLWDIVLFPVLLLLILIIDNPCH